MREIKDSFHPNRYSITIQRRRVDGLDLFVGTVAELPDVCFYESSNELAYSVLIDVIWDLKAIADKNEYPFPKPLEG